MPNLNPAGLLFSTVDQFIEQVGRRKQWKYGDLDTLVCVWNGPSASAVQFKPNVNSRHPQYPLMFCTDSQITDNAALVSEIQATYQGIIQTNGASKYITPGIVSTNPIQGSRDFQLPYSQVVGIQRAPIGSSSGGQGTYQGPIYAVGTQRVNVRYIGSQVSVRYQAYPRRSADHPNYSGLGLSLVKWQILSQFPAEISITATGVVPSIAPQTVAVPRVPPLLAAYMGMQMQQKGLWYDVTENYAPTF